MSKKNNTIALALGLAIAVTGCNSSSSSSNNNQAGISYDFSGTAATGKAIVGGTVTAKCANSISTNDFVSTAVTDGNGKWSANLAAGAELPCAIEVSGGNPAQILHSYASTIGTVNITPLTDLSLAVALGDDPANWFASFAGDPITNLEDAATALVSSLDNKGFSTPNSTDNIFTQPFDANHSGWDKVLDQLQITIDKGTDTYQDLLTTLAAGGIDGLDSNLPEAVIPSFTISGSISGNISGEVKWQTKIGGNTPVTATSSSSTSIIFAENVPEDSTYVITVTQSPVGKVCSVSHGAGNISANVTNVVITCTDETTDPGNGGDLVSALKALGSGNNGKLFEVTATGTGGNAVDSAQNSFRRGLRADMSYPRCDGLGYDTVNEFNQAIDRWSAKLSIDSSTGAVTLANPSDASLKITLSPSGANTTLSSPSSMPIWQWASQHPEATLYLLNYREAYTVQGHSGSFYRNAELSLGVINNTIEAIKYKGDPGSEIPYCEGSELMPALVDRLSPLKALAGSYSVMYNYHADEPTWSGLTIGTDGALTFGGDGPSMAPADIKGIKLHRANQGRNSADDRVWALTIEANKDITGDNDTNERDLINLFLNDDGSLRDIQYLIEEIRYDINNAPYTVTTPVEVSVVAPAFPAFDDTLAAQLSGNGVIGKLDGEVRTIAASTFDGNSLRVSLKAQQGENYADDMLRWTVTVSLIAETTNYDCKKVTGSYTTISFENKDDTYSTQFGGTCEIIVSQVHKNGNKTTGMEGKFRALLWEAHSRRFVPAVGYFTYQPL